jgi:hypothetical protein
MSSAERIALAIVGVGAVTTLILPGRQSVALVNAIANLFRGSLATAMGTGKKV